MREHESLLELLLLRIYQFVKFQSLLLLRCCFHTVVDYCQRAYDHSESNIVYSRTSVYANFNCDNDFQHEESCGEILIEIW